MHDGYLAFHILARCIKRLIEVAIRRLVHILLGLDLPLLLPVFELLHTHQLLFFTRFMDRSQLFVRCMRRRQVKIPSKALLEAQYSANVLQELD